jgi:hypothetical protein
MLTPAISLSSRRGRQRGEWASPLRTLRRGPAGLFDVAGVGGAFKVHGEVDAMHHLLADALAEGVAGAAEAGAAGDVGDVLVLELGCTR